MHTFTLAFATARHAHHAMRFLHDCELAILEGEVTGGAGGDFATCEVQVSAQARGRLLTLVAGLNGLVVAEATLTSGGAVATAVA